MHGGQRCWFLTRLAGWTSVGLQTYESGAINRGVWPSQRAYIWLYMSGPGIYVYGVTVEYHRNI
jgi:hypothetical protein